MTQTTWRQVVYGKLVKTTAPDSDIVGEDYCQTGTSKNAPRELAHWCYPDRVGIYVDDQKGWTSDYKWWAEPGALVVRPVIAEGRPYVVAACLRGRYEEPNAKRRIFTYGHYLTSPGEQGARLPLIDLPADLKPRLLTHKTELEPVVLEERDRELSVDWLDDAEPLLSAILSGQAVAATGDLRPTEFFRQAMNAIACLPGALRWRIPVGAGLCKLNVDEIALGHGMSTRCPTRLRGLEWTGGADVEPERLHRAKEYATWARAELKGCRRLSEVVDTVDRAFPHLASFDAIPVAATESTSSKNHVDWRGAVTLFQEELRQEVLLRELSQDLAKPATAPRTIKLSPYYEVRLLRMLGETWAAAKSHWSFAVYCPLLADHDEAWRTASNSPAGKGDHYLRAWAILLGHVDGSAEEAGGALQAVIPSPLHSSVIRNLHHRLLCAAETRTLTDWSQLILWSVLQCGKPSDGAGILAPSTLIGRDFLWAMWIVLPSLSAEHREVLLKKCRWPEFLALVDLAAGQSPQPASFDDLLRFIESGRGRAHTPFEQLVRAQCTQLIAGAVRRRLYGEAVLLNHSAAIAGIPAQAFPPDDAATVCEIGAKLPELGWRSLLITYVLSRSRLIGRKRLGDDVWQALAQRVGAPWSELFFNDAVVGSVDQAAAQAAAAAFPRALRDDPALHDRATRLSVRDSGIALRTELLKWIKEISQPPKTEPTTKLIAWLGSLLSKRHDVPLPSQSLEDARIVHQLLPTTFTHSQRYDVGGVDELLAYLASHPKHLPSCRREVVVTLLNAALATQTTPEPEFIRDRLRELEATTVAPWRLLFTEPVVDFSDEEQAILKLASFSTNVRSLLQGQPLPLHLQSNDDYRSAAVDGHWLAMTVSRQDHWKLLLIAEQHQAFPLAFRLLASALDSLKRRGVPHLAVSKTLEPKGRFPPRYVPQTSIVREDREFETLAHRAAAICLLPSPVDFVKKRRPLTFQHRKELIDKIWYGSDDFSLLTLSPRDYYAD
ncbi:MAG: hypothetical protein QM775_24510 [Pirellulales bacterium]